MGNICRSPAAEAVLRQFVSHHPNPTGIEIDSAGTHDFNLGRPADARMLRAAQQRGYELTSRARQITVNDLMSFGLVVVMDHHNLAAVQSLHDQPRSQIVLLSHFLDSSWPAEMPDPYQGEPQDFELVLDMLEAACPKILAQLLE